MPVLSLDEELKRLSPQDRQQLAAILRERAVSGSSDTAYQMMAAVYEELPVPMEEFLDGRDFLSMGKIIYPKVRDTLMEIDDPDIREFDLIWGKGSGKSAVCSITMLRQVYRTLCYRNPQRFLDKMDGSPIVILNLSINAEQALKVIFAEFISRLKSCAWFRERYIEKFRTVEFPKSISAVAGHSGSTSWLGYNSIYGCLDEANYFLDEGRKSVAEDLEGTLRGSLTTRFPYHYKCGRISSVRTHGDFMFEKVEEVKEEGIEVPWSELGRSRAYLH